MRKDGDPYCPTMFRIIWNGTFIIFIRRCLTIFAMFPQGYQTDLQDQYGSVTKLTLRINPNVFV
jgi:hypothetical protein